MCKNQSVAIKNGVLPSHDAKFPEDIAKVVELDWKVELLLEEHPSSDGEVFIAKMTSKYGQTKPIYCICSDFLDKKKKDILTSNLVNRGRFHPDELPAFIQYVDCLKVSGQYIKNDEGYKEHITETTELKNEDEAEKVYRAIVEHAIENESVFPNKGEYKNGCDGIRFTAECELERYGNYSIAFEASKFRDLIDIPNTKKVNSILSYLASKRLFFPGSNENRKKVTLETGYAHHCYIFKIDTSVLAKGGK